MEHSCKKAGASGCGFTTRADTEEELMRKVADHARKKHGVPNVTGTIAAYLADTAKNG